MTLRHYRRAPALLLGLFSIYLSLSTAASDLGNNYKRCGSGEVTAVLSGDTIVLANDLIVKLADIKAPEYWGPDMPYKSWPYGSATKAALNTLILGEIVTLRCDKKTHNALGQLVAHIELSDGIWLQKVLIETGQGFFYPTTRNVKVSQHLQANERKARREKLGLWENHIYQITAATGTELKPGWFQIVQGKVVSAAKVRKNIYLNFGKNWREDFTIQFDAQIAKQLRKQGIDPISLEGKNIEVRGWVEWSGGPKIILTHPNQIQVLTVSQTR